VRAPIKGALFYTFKMKHTFLLFILYSIGSFSQNLENIPSIFPIDSKEKFQITSDFGVRNHPIEKITKKHLGIDIAVQIGTYVYATANGCIETSAYENGHGQTILISHDNNITTRYSHLALLFVSKGEEIKQGDIIGLVGSTGKSTGNHLHYEIRRNNTAINPKPFLFLKYEKENGL